MDDLPTRIKNNLGITVEVNLLQEENLYFIEIIVPPYSVPISLRGRYYYRSGSVMQELTGASLNELLLKRAGLTWDEVIEQRATFADIDEDAFCLYLQMAKENGRMPEIGGLSTEQIFEKLRLSENAQLKRAAIIMFGKDPVRFYPGAFVKIGRFGKNDTDLRFQEVEEGNLIVLLRNVIEQLNHKFLMRPIEFEGLYRIEKHEYPVPAIREMLLNALIHRAYMGSFIQIRIYDDKISIWNDGGLPTGMSLEKLKQSHSSKPRNLIIADVCFKGGLIDAWGRGTIKIIETCLEAGLPEPELIERDGGFLVTLFKDKFTEEQLVRLGLNQRQLKAVQYVKAKGKITNKEYQEVNEVSKRTASNDLSELVEKYQILKQLGASVSTYYEIT
jgi:ATP-dependent DNA helicase RecG